VTLDLYLVPAEAERAPLDDRHLVVVDVLRSCTSIAEALVNGAAKIIPVETVEEATRLAATLDPRSLLLCGEREGRKVSGFDLGNSPREYTRAKVLGATLIFASTNASPLMAGLLGGRELLLLGYANLGSVAETLRKDPRDVAILCAGRNGRFSLEDAACAGALIDRLEQAFPEARPNDAAAVAREYHRQHGRNPEAILRASEHGRYLIELGFEEDLPICATIDRAPVTPVLRDGRISATNHIVA
jgi:2-phosphosulfolactate phosphatase